MLAKMLDASKTDPINANHHARTAGPRTASCRWSISSIVPEMLIAYIGMRPMRSACRCKTGMTAAQTLIKARVCGIGDQLVILDEVDVGGAKAIDDFRRFVRKQAYARLDDRSDHWSVVDLGERHGFRRYRIEGPGTAPRTSLVDRGQAGAALSLPLTQTGCLRLVDKRVGRFAPMLSTGKAISISPR